MKKYLIFFATAALALIGCKKEIPTITGGDQTVTFSVVADNAATKADPEVTAIPDGINRCLAVVRMYDANNQLLDAIYAKPVVTIAADKSKAEFSVDLMGGQTYEVTVLLYTQGVYDVNENLTVIKRAAAELPYNLHAEHDLFSASITYEAGDNTPLIIAKRPFAQLNLITTDLVQNFEPAVTVKYTAPDTFNAVTGEASGERVYETLGVVTSYDYAPNQCTISSDYIFASDEKSLISVEMKAEKVGTFVRTFNNLPLQRNYKTNVIGKLLTVDSPFTVQVNDNWSTPDNDIQWQSAENIAAANAILAADATDGKDVNIKVNVPDDAATVPVIFTPKNEDTNVALKFEQNTSATPMTITFTKDAVSTENPASVTVEAPAGTTLVFETETHVVINGTNYGVISGTFSANTLVINKGVSVGKVIMTAGGLEVHGTLGAFEAAEGHGEIIVRECEGLSAEVKDALSPYICSGYEAFEVEGKWNIADHSVCSIGSVKYLTLARAIEAAQADDVINILSDINVENSSISLAGRSFAIGVGKSLIINGNGYTVKNTSNSPRALFGVYGNEDLINVTFKNIKLESVAERVIETRGNIASITLDNADLISKYPYNATAFQIGGNQSSKAKVTIKNSSIVAGNSGYPYLSYNPADVILEESTLSGYCGLYFKSPSSSAGSRGSVVTAKKSKFECPNLFEAAGQNSFGVFVCEDDDITISLENCITHAEQYGTARQTAFVLSSAAQRCEQQCTFNISGDGSLIGALISQNPIAWGNDPKYTLTIKGGTFTNDPSNFVPNGYEVVENGDGTYSVVKGAPVAPDWAAVPTPTVVVNDQAALEAAINAVPEGGSAVIGLGNGEFTTYGKGLSTIGKNFTFVGAGVENTVWKYGKSSEASGEGASDYSFDGSGDLKFCNLTLSDNCTTKNYYRGFVRSNSFTCVGCKITNVISYMYGPVKFYGCEFVTEVADSFNVKLYAGTSFEFDTCTFKSPYGFIDAYRQNTLDGWLDCIVTNCTFIGTASSPASKPAVRLCDYTANGEGGFWNVYFNGTNTATNIAVDSTTGSNLYGSRFYTGYTPYGAKVYFDNNLVWEHK